MSQALSLEFLIMTGVSLIFMTIMTSIIATSYKRCPPNKAMIISGMGALHQSGSLPFKVITCGGTVAIPVIHEISYLSLEVMKLRMQAVLNSADDVPLQLDAVALVKVRNDEVGIALAATQLLSKSEAELAEIYHAILLPKLQDQVREHNAKDLLNSFSDTGNQVRERES